MGEKHQVVENKGYDALQTWWGLSYAQYLTIPRSVMQAMPDEWQAKMAALLEELDETLEWRPKEGCYWVKLKDDKGKYMEDPLYNYRYPPEIRRKNENI